MAPRPLNPVLSIQDMGLPSKVGLTYAPCTCVDTGQCSVVIFTDYYSYLILWLIVGSS